MKKSLVGILAAAGFVAAGSIGTQGCSGTSGVDGGGPELITVCSADTDCSGVNGLCNTTAHVCMQKCASINDCPATDNSCAAYTPPGGAATSGTVCSAGTGCTAPNVINPLDGLCETACSSTAGCTGYSSSSPRECVGGICVAAVADAGLPDAGGGGCADTAACQTGTTVGDACESMACVQVQCETPTYSYAANAGPIVWGTTNNGTVADTDTADGMPCDTGGGMVNQWTSNVYFPAGDAPLASSSGSNYKAVFSVKTSGALAGNTYFAVTFNADNTQFTWQECLGGSAATGMPTAVAVEDENMVYSNNDCVQ